MSQTKYNIAYDKGVRVFIELGTHLQLKIEESNLSLKSEMIGMEVDKYLIVKVYKMNEEHKDLIARNEVNVIYLHKNSILGFKSNVITIISKPESIVFLEYPKEIKSYNVRTDERIVCFLPIKLEIEYNIVEGFIVDINNAGCCCVLRDFKITDEQTIGNVTIHLENSKMEHDYTMLGSIKSIRHKNNELYIGIMFIKMDRNTEDAIQAIIPNLTFNDKTNVL